jgi:hypothetical protein
LEITLCVVGSCDVLWSLVAVFVVGSCDHV